MSSNLPLRTVRIPALRQQCLFQHRRSVQSPRAFSTTTPQAFACTFPRYRDGSSIGQGDRSTAKAAMKYQMGPAPRVQQRKQQEEGAMQEDIGLLQDTMIRAGLRRLPSVLSPSVYGYFWKLLKTKGTAFYSRIQYNRCINGNRATWEGWKRVDRFKGAQIKLQAKTLYKQLYLSFVSGDMTPVSKHCLSPVLKEFQNRIKARGSGTKMEWKITKGPSAQIVSHRASLLGEDQPNSAFRQIVVRITSEQQLTLSWSGNRGARSASGNKNVGGWTPQGVMAKPSREAGLVEDVSDGVRESSERKKVVEYMVLQKRVIDGNQDPHWKIWGFAQESTLDSLAEDEEYWRRTLNTQTAAA